MNKRIKKYNKNGFTLIELLAVIIILGIIALIAIPVVTNVIEESRQGAFESTVTNISNKVKETCTTEQIKEKNIIEHYIIENNIISPKIEINGELPDGDLFVDSSCGVTFILSNKNYIATKNDPNGKVIIEKNNGLSKYSEDILNGANPVLDNIMIPITLTNDGTSRKADLYSEWYNYQNQKWANAVIVKEEVKEAYREAKHGEVIKKEDILAYLVWIPRYKYFNSTSGTTNPSSINIVFENKDKPKSVGNSINSYYTHPAFTFGNKELNGIWVGKFETTGTSEEPTVLSNVASLRSQPVKEQFETALKFKKYGVLGDTHMMKNSEWGATAHLANSKYGINKEVRLNNNSNYITGCGASSDNEAQTPTCQIIYGKANNYPQSTTGNITGIFDMSGGATDVVMANYNNITEYSSFTKMPEPKYYDLYNTTNIDTACNTSRCYGHALSGTSGWYNDNARFVSESNPWVGRGHFYSGTDKAGIYAYSSIFGGSVSYFTFRLTIS